MLLILWLIVIWSSIFIALDYFIVFILNRYKKEVPTVRIQFQWILGKISLLIKHLIEMQTGLSIFFELLIVLNICVFLFVMVASAYREYFYKIDFTMPIIYLAEASCLISVVSVFIAGFLRIGKSLLKGILLIILAIILIPIFYFYFFIIIFYLFSHF